MATDPTKANQTTTIQGAGTIAVSIATILKGHLTMSPLPLNVRYLAGSLRRVAIVVS